MFLRLRFQAVYAPHGLIFARLIFRPKRHLLIQSCCPRSALALHRAVFVPNNHRREFPAILCLRRVCVRRSVPVSDVESFRCGHFILPYNLRLAWRFSSRLIARSTRAFSSCARAQLDEYSGDAHGFEGLASEIVLSPSVLPAAHPARFLPSADATFANIAACRLRVFRHSSLISSLCSQNLFAMSHLTTHFLEDRLHQPRMICVHPNAATAIAQTDAANAAARRWWHIGPRVMPRSGCQSDDDAD